jgi:CheY-like chemotaxis protein
MSDLRDILLVEDDSHDVELTLEALAAHNLANAVVTVRDGADALDYLYRRQRHAGRGPDLPAVVLLDLKLPKVSGLEVLRAVKGDAALRHLPIVVLTSSRESPDLQACYDLGVNAYVVKPVQFAAFVDAVKHIGAFWAILNETPACYRRGHH